MNNIEINKVFDEVNITLLENMKRNVLSLLEGFQWLLIGIIILFGIGIFYSYYNVIGTLFVLVAYILILIETNKYKLRLINSEVINK